MTLETVFAGINFIFHLNGSDWIRGIMMIVGILTSFSHLGDELVITEGYLSEQVMKILIRKPLMTTGLASHPFWSTNMAYYSEILITLQFNLPKKLIPNDTCFPTKASTWKLITPQHPDFPQEKLAEVRLHSFHVKSKLSVCGVT